jgi:hypothetical protein
MQSVSYQSKVDNQFFPELLVYILSLLLIIRFVASMYKHQVQLLLDDCSMHSANAIGCASGTAA